jgi:demethylmenaquinone methyltransferase/2-methoxy-6-polyprenyl-1,4-benzoquinol methylase
MFSSISHRYDLNNRVHSMGRDQAWRRRAVAMATITSTDDVVDVACGTGDLTEALADAGPASICGIDFTPEMIELAIAKATRRGDRHGLPTPTYTVGDAMAMNLSDESVDVVTIAFGLRNVQSPTDAITEFSRVLRPGGRLVVLEFSTPLNPVVRAGNHIYTHHIMPLTATLLSGDRSGAYRYLPRSIDTFARAEDVAELLRGGGLSEISQTSLTLGVCTITVGIK